MFPLASTSALIYGYLQAIIIAKTENNTHHM